MWPQTSFPPPLGRVTRVVTLPIREIVGSEISVIDTFRKAWRLRDCPWPIGGKRELVTRDVVRTPTMRTLPKYDRKQMFGKVPRRFNRVPKPPFLAAAAGDPWLPAVSTTSGRAHTRRLTVRSGMGQLSVLAMF